MPDAPIEITTLLVSVFTLGFTLAGFLAVWLLRPPPPYPRVRWWHWRIKRDFRRINREP